LKIDHAHQLHRTIRPAAAASPDERHPQKQQHKKGVAGNAKLLMNHANLHHSTTTGIPPAVIDPAIMNGVNGNTTTEKKNGKNGKEPKVTLDKNGKPKRKKASRGMFPYKPSLFLRRPGGLQAMWC